MALIGMAVGEIHAEMIVVDVRANLHAACNILTGGVYGFMSDSRISGYN
jgi:hypothetical protein